MLGELGLRVRGIRVQGSGGFWFGARGLGFGLGIAGLGFGVWLRIRGFRAGLRFRVRGTRV